MAIISKTQSVILAASLIVLGVLGGCTVPPTRQVGAESTNPDTTQSKNLPEQGAQGLSGSPIPYQVEENKTPDGIAPMNGLGTAIGSKEQPMAESAKTAVTLAPLLKLLSNEEVAKLIPGHVRNPAGWAEDILRVFSALSFQPSPPNVCSVLAIIQQESGFQANPTVQGMRQVILNSLKKKYGKLGKVAVEKLLDVKTPGEKKSLWNKLMAAKTEYDVDRVFRDYVVYQKVNHPGLINMAAYTGKAFGVDDLDQLNPITTIGSMQVSVKYSKEQSKASDIGEWKTREFLYTRYGGVYFGIRRLLGYQTSYIDPIYRFADYNLGMYASRNAALQYQLSSLIGYKLALDGDLLRYLKNGTADSDESESEKAILVFAKRFAPWLDKRTIHNDLYLEKSPNFEYTKTYLAIKHAYAVTYGTPPYASLPVVEITGPKIKSKFTTALYAKAVNAKYQRCFNQAR